MPSKEALLFGDPKVKYNVHSSSFHIIRVQAGHIAGMVGQKNFVRGKSKIRVAFLL